MQPTRLLQCCEQLKPSGKILPSLLNRYNGIKTPKLRTGYGYINLPLRVQRIALRQAFSDLQPRLVGRLRPWPITLRHYHIAKAIERVGYAPVIMSKLRCCLG